MWETRESDLQDEGEEEEEEEERCSSDSVRNRRVFGFFVYYQWTEQGWKQQPGTQQKCVVASRAKKSVSPAMVLLSGAGAHVGTPKLENDVSVTAALNVSSSAFLSCICTDGKWCPRCDTDPPYFVSSYWVTLTHTGCNMCVVVLVCVTQLFSCGCFLVCDILFFCPLMLD